MIDRSIDLRSRDIICPTADPGETHAQEKTSAESDLEESQIDHFDKHSESTAIIINIHLRTTEPPLVYTHLQLNKKK